jgi:hypothetical protein
MRGSGTRWRRLARGTAVGMLALALIVAKVAWEGRREWKLARAAESRGDAHVAAMYYGRAVHMYVPGWPLPMRAARRLLELGDAAEGRGDALEARYCYEEARSGLLAVRSFWQPGRELVAEAEQRMLPLMLSDPRGNWPDRALPEAERAAALRAVLASREDPAPGWVLLMGIGYVAWLGAAGMAILRGVPEREDEPFAWAPLLRWSGASLLGFLAWLLGVWRA